MVRVDLNADVGEGFADAALVPYVTSASIACGGHAGDASTMRATIALALRHGVAIGAHPGFPDRGTFGRRVTTREPAMVEALVGAQLGDLRAQAAALGAELAFVKPHGALYNLAADDVAIARAIARATRRVLPRASLVLLAGSRALLAAGVEGLATVAEGFVDRGYLPSGALAPRGTAGATIDDADQAARRAVDLALHSRIEPIGGGQLDLAVDTLCIHGDGPNAPAIARRVRAALEAAGAHVLPFAR